MLLRWLAHTVALHQLFKAMMGGADHRTIAAADNTGIIETMLLQKLTACSPSKAVRAGYSPVVKLMANTGRSRHTGCEGVDRTGPREFHLGTEIFARGPSCSKIVDLRKQLNNLKSIEQGLRTLGPIGQCKENIAVEPCHQTTSSGKRL
jgi:hypothetical protein